MRNNNKVVDIYDVLQSMVLDGSKTSAELAAYLFPHLGPDSANKRLAKSISKKETDREELTIKQLLAAMQHCDCYLPLYYLCEQTNHYRPEKKASNDVEAQLAKAITDAAEIMKVAVAALEKHKNR